MEDPRLELVEGERQAAEVGLQRPLLGSVGHATRQQQLGRFLVASVEWRQLRPHCASQTRSLPHMGSGAGGSRPRWGPRPTRVFFFSCRVREPRTDDGQTLAGGHTATRVGRQRYEIGDVGSVVSGVEQVIIDAVIGASRNPCRLHFQMEFVRVSGQISKLRKIVVLFPLQRTGTVFRKKMAINQSGLGVSRLSLGSRDLRGSWSFLRM